MENYESNEDFGPAHYDYNFDFDVDLRLSAFEYILLGLYAVFIFPFVLLIEVVGKVMHRNSGQRENAANKNDYTSEQRYDMPLAPCCVWPRESHS